ncbi:low-density lipoprotein receptor-related protein 2-like [Sitodiplosis mosellana]|uniref:low-density lipoprotein receptor-related protein 2-like n=1 Tax=Sitodiplosis mosellana TaxID=263140 RepID=UPI0024446015|nr:low-density lipoprotein receptor-related protein 2-like [Sitodiplosis mosellana]
MPLKVGTGEEARVYCYTKGDKPITIEWHYEGNRPLPNNVEAIDNYLQFDNISMGNGGRYHCTVTNRHGRTTKAAELIVTYNEPICNENEFQCNDGSCISSHYRCDKAQARHCPDGEDEVGCPRRGGCSPEEFRCTDGSCIDRTKLCNDFADCTGGEDEDNRNCLRQPNYNIRNQWYPRQGH